MPPYLYTYIYICIQCAARISRHRAVMFSTASCMHILRIVGICFIARRLRPRNSKKKQAVRSGFSRASEVRIVIFRDVGGSRQPLEPVLMILGIVVILMARPVRKRSRFFSQNATTDTFFAVLCLLCFF